MSTPLTEHVKDLAKGSPSLSDLFLSTLKSLVRSELRRRNLWNAPPSFLGYDAPNWISEIAFDDLTHDCYLHAILKRKDSLAAQSQQKESIDGYIRLNIRNFFTERQRKYDPVGYAVYQNLKEATLVEWRNGTIQIDPEPNPKLSRIADVILQSNTRALPTSREVIRNTIRRSEVIQSQVETLCTSSQVGVQGARRVLGELRQSINCYTVEGLANELSQFVREHVGRNPNQTSESIDDHPTLERVWTIITSELLENAELLKSKVFEKIEGLDRQERVRNNVRSVFQAIIERVGQGEQVTQSELVEGVGIPRSTMSEIFKILQNIVQEIQKNSEQ